MVYGSCYYISCVNTPGWTYDNYAFIESDKVMLYFLSWLSQAPRFFLSLYFIFTMS
jgi:hypothetical protein